MDHHDIAAWINPGDDERDHPVSRGIDNETPDSDEALVVGARDKAGISSRNEEGWQRINLDRDGALATRSSDYLHARWTADRVEDEKQSGLNAPDRRQPDEAAGDDRDERRSSDTRAHQRSIQPTLPRECSPTVFPRNELGSPKG